MHKWRGGKHYGSNQGDCCIFSRALTCTKCPARDKLQSHTGISHTKQVVIQNHHLQRSTSLACCRGKDPVPTFIESVWVHTCTYVYYYKWESLCVLWLRNHTRDQNTYIFMTPRYGASNTNVWEIYACDEKMRTFLLKYINTHRTVFDISSIWAWDVTSMGKFWV